MIITQLQGISEARNAKGTAIIIDIMRAATTAAYAFGQGAKEILPVATKEEARLLKKQNSDYLLMGEEKGYTIAGFDFGNSPTEIEKVDLANKSLVQRTSSGTQGLSQATQASEMIFGSFVTASAIIKYLKQQNPSHVSIVAIDGEDTIFANYIEHLLLGKDVDHEQVKQDLYSHPYLDWFRDPNKPEFPEEDINKALQFDKFNFVCRVQKENERLIMRKTSA